MKTVSSIEMKQLDNIATSKYAIPGIILMENAGRAVAFACASELKTLDLKSPPKVLAVCGSGNNAGDGLVAARYLYNMSIDTEILLLKGPSDFRGDTLTNFEIVKNMGINILPDKDNIGYNNYSLIIDAILGTGATGDVREPYKSEIDKINKSLKPVISVDIPSGLNADTGAVMGNCIKAAITVTMALLKNGLSKEKAKSFTGNIVIADIGFPKELMK